MEGRNTQRKRELEDYQTKGNDTGKEKAEKKKLTNRRKGRSYRGGNISRKIIGFENCMS